MTSLAIPVQMDLMDLMDLCQRWRDRRPSYRPAGVLFDARHASVQLIDDGLAELDADYIHRLKACGWLAPLRHPGNHTFTWSF